MKKYLSKSPRETAELAKLLAEESLMTDLQKHALVIGLVGNLGAGKTLFIQSFIRALGVSGRITSPTFLILRKYGLPRGGRFRNVFHADAYRIENVKELCSVGFKEVLGDRDNIVLVEWAGKIRKALPQNTIWISFDYGKDEKERHIAFD